jgi:hypothetical protein
VRMRAQPCLAKRFRAIGDEQRQDVEAPNVKKRREIATLLCCCKCYTRLKRVVYFTCRAECEACDAAVRPRPTAAGRRP